jgi:hypothetical protein
MGLASKTALQYLSGVKETILKIYPHNPVWYGHDATNSVAGIKAWYTDIRKALEKDINYRLILAGDSVESKAYPLGRFAVQNIIQHYLKKGNMEGVEKAVAVLTDFLSIGRGGEVGYATYAQSYWNEIEQVLYMDWNEPKVRKQNPMNFYPDYNNFRSDCYFIMCIYCIVGGGERHTVTGEFREEMALRGNYDSSLLYPSLATKSSTKTSSYIATCVGIVDGLPVDDKVNISSRSLRYGSLQECCINNTCGREAAIFRGVWESL